MRTLSAVLPLVLLLGAAPARALTGEELAAKNLAARGGAAALRAIGALRLSGKVVYGGDDWSMEMAWTRLWKRPGLVRNENSVQGLTSVSASDGREGWRVSPFGGRREPEKVSAEEARDLLRDGDLDGPLVAGSEQGRKLAYLGVEDVDGTPAHKLRVTHPDGTVQDVFLDPDHFLEIRVETRSRIRGAEVVMEKDLGAYERVAGVWFPFSIDLGEKGGPKTTRITVERAEVGLALDDTLFRQPPPGTRVGPASLPPIPPAPPVSVPPPAARASGPARLDAGVLSGLPARNIGSATMSGRIAAVAGRTHEGKTTLLVGAASGGIWKSDDGGTSFRPVFDLMPVQSIGALAIDPTRPENVWAGTGESWTRNSVSVGDGIYKSTDGGETWSHAGLPESERITRITVDPRSSEVVYACVPGKLWSDSPDRGVYKTGDGGKTWALVLRGPNLSTGCSGLALDPRNPDRLLAGLWDFRRKAWTFRSGGDGPNAPSGSGLYRTEDGGRTWTELTDRTAPGLPPKPWGRVEVVLAPSDGRIGYAFVESAASALYRTGDGGRTWEARDHSQMMVWRPFYFGRLVVDPVNPDRLFKPDLTLVVSEDGGKSFARTGGGSHGDWHDLWIDPENPRHVVGGDDGGLWMSVDGGSRWAKVDNLPVSQFYHVSADGQDPYQVYGGLQDNGSWAAPSAYPGGIPNAAWELMNGSDGFWAFADPVDPQIVYSEGQGGYLARLDRRTRGLVDIQPKAGYREKLRFNWNTPVHLSPTRPGTLYVGAQFLFRSRDRGDSWERISPDLTSNDPEKQKQELSGGITVDNSAAETHTTIYSIAESPRNPQVIWVGTDDGNLQLTRDGGKSWTNLARNLPGLPPASWVSWVEASRFDEAVAYAAVDRHTAGDLTPWVFRTGDHGKTWKRIAGPAQGVRGYAHVVREDLVAPGILFLGTEVGLWVTVDGGASWAEFKGGRFPAVAVRDLWLQPREGDLVIATHGRGIWVVDDLTPLRALSAELLAKEAAFLPGRPAQQRIAGLPGWVLGDDAWLGEAPPSGAVLTYYQRTRHLFGPLKLEVLDGAGKVLDTVPASKRRGLNRATWSMRLPPPRSPRGATLAGNAAVGPRVLPGEYRVRLTKGSQVVEAPLRIVLDRRAPYGEADRRVNQEAALRVHAFFGKMTDLAERLEALHAGAEARAAALPAGDGLAGRLRDLAARSDELRKRIVATKEGGAITGEERLREHADQLYGSLLGWEGRPPRDQLERIEALERELADLDADLAKLVGGDLPAIDRGLRERKLEPVPVEPQRRAEAPGGVLRAAFSTAQGRAVGHLGKWGKLGR